MSDARKLKDEAAAAAGKGRYKRAAELYEQIARFEPDDGQWPHRAGEAWKRVGDRQASIDALSTASDIYARTGFFLKAISVSKMILELDPGRTETQARLAALYARRDAKGPGGGGGGLRGGVPVERGPSSGSPASSASSAARSRTGPPPRVIDLPPDPIAPPPASRPAYPPIGEAPPPVIVSRHPSSPPQSPPAPRPAPPFHAPPVPPPVSRPAAAAPPAPPPLPPLPPPAPAAATSSRSGRLPTLDSFEPIPLPDFSLSLAEPEHAFEHAAEEAETLSLEIVPVDFTPPPPPPPSATRGGPSRPLGIEHEKPLNQRVPGAKVSQTFLIPNEAFEIPLEESGGIHAISTSDLPRIPLFSSLDEARLHRLIQGAHVVRCQPGDVVVRQGERGESLFVVVHGTMAVHVDGAHEPVARLGDGQFFGELALLSSEPRSATVVAESEAELLEIKRDVVWELIEDSPDVLPVLLGFFRERLTERLMATSPLFSPFTSDDALQLAGRFQFLELRADSQLVREGERAEGLYVILLGRCEVHMARAGGTVATVGPGDLVGEISLLTHGPATATVTAVTPVWALAMPRAVFQEVILTHPQVLIYVSEVAEQRRAADVSRVDFI